MKPNLAAFILLTGAWPHWPSRANMVQHYPSLSPKAQKTLDLQKNMLHNIKMKCALRESYNVLKLKKGDLVMIKNWVMKNR